MPRKSYKPEEIVAKLRQVDVLTSQGKNVAEAIRSIGISEVTYYRWRQEFGGLKSDQVKRLKDLETENTRLRRRALGPVHPARRSRVHPFRQRPGVHRSSGAGLDRRRRLKDRHISPDSPWENGEIFYSLHEAEIVIESWRRHYNMVRPHASIGYRAPAPEVFVPALAAWPAAQPRPAPPAMLPLLPRPALN